MDSPMRALPLGKPASFPRPRWSVSGDPRADIRAEPKPASGAPRVRALRNSVAALYWLLAQATPGMALMRPGSSSKDDGGEDMRLNPVLDRLSPYRAGPPLAEIRSRYGLETVARLSANESPYGPFPEVCGTRGR